MLNVDTENSMPSSFAIRSKDVCDVEGSTVLEAPVKKFGRFGNRTALKFGVCWSIR
jgi:hypothetical protein